MATEEMSDGTILDLVSRGKKDAYQIQDPERSWFGSPYNKRSPATREIRLLYPENPPRFGQAFDIVIPSDGDILMSLDLRITMPTWLPPNIAAINTQSFRYSVTLETDPYEIKAYPYAGKPPEAMPGRIVPTYPYTVVNPDPVHYGWVDGVANYLINKWQLFVDNVLILEGYGEFNTWFPDMDTTQLQAPITHASTGLNQGTTQGIQANATLPELVFRVPLPGCQGRGDPGLPICAFPNQKVYVRFFLLGIKDLVESSPLLNSPPPSIPPPQYMPEALPCYVSCPTPWGGRTIYVNGSPFDPVTFEPYGITLSSAKMGQPYIYARTVVLNVENELQKSLEKQKFEIRFRQQRLDYWTVDNKSFISGAQYRQTLQIHGLFQSLFLFFRSIARTYQNKYTDLLPSYGSWLSALALNVNGQDRIYNWTPQEMTTLANNTQLARDVEFALYYLIFGISPDDEPAGTCNLSRCQKAVLNLQFSPDVQADPMTDSNTTYAYIIGMSWNVLDIKNGLAIMRFPN